jgi:hypothetical protein
MEVSFGSRLVRKHYFSFKDFYDFFFEILLRTSMMTLLKTVFQNSMHDCLVFHIISTKQLFLLN